MCREQVPRLCSDEVLPLLALALEEGASQIKQVAWVGTIVEHGLHMLVPWMIEKGACQVLAMADKIWQTCLVLSLFTHIIVPLFKLYTVCIHSSSYQGFLADYCCFHHLTFGAAVCKCSPVLHIWPWLQYLCNLQVSFSDVRAGSAWPEANAAGSLVFFNHRHCLTTTRCRRIADKGNSLRQMMKSTNNRNRPLYIYIYMYILNCVIRKIGEGRTFILLTCWSLWSGLKQASMIDCRFFRDSSGSPIK